MNNYSSFNLKASKYLASANLSVAKIFVIIFHSFEDEIADQASNDGKYVFFMTNRQLSK